MTPIVPARMSSHESLIPDDIKIEFLFDQSIFVTNALRGLAVEGVLGALLTGLPSGPAQCLHRRRDDPVCAARVDLCGDGGPAVRSQ